VPNRGFKKYLLHKEKKDILIRFSLLDTVFPRAKLNIINIKLCVKFIF
jgi:hypothetical protein